MGRLSHIRAITLAFDDTRRLDDALAIVASRVRAATAADLAVVYLQSEQDARIVRRAIDRGPDIAERSPLLVEATALAERVARRREPIKVDDLGAGIAGERGRPRLRPRGSLLAVPVVHYGQSTGVVLVASAAPGTFSDQDLDLLITAAAQIAGRVSRAVIREDLDEALTGGGRAFAGAAGSPGLAIGRVVAVGRIDISEVPDRLPGDVDREIALVREAVAAFRSELDGFGATGPFGAAGAEAGAIFDVYRQLLGEEGLIDEIVSRVRAGNWARGALRRVIEEKAAVFERLDDSYLRARAEDFREIGRRILHHLDAPQGAAREYPDASILAADEIGIVELAQVPRERLIGIVSRRGSVLSHAAVLARALGVPAVMGLSDLPVAALDGREVVVDGDEGVLVVAPPPQVLATYRSATREAERLAERFAEHREEPATTRDGTRIAILAKAGMLADLDDVRGPESDGIGLYRTEFTFMTRSSFPSEQEQRRVYREVLAAMAPRPVTVRTLDAGGDKALPYFTVEERNPFLGWRGIRMSLDHPELFLTQVRAMLLANVGLGNLRIMFPMVASVGELEDALDLLEQARTELVEEDERLDAFEVGLMVEVPSAVYQVEALARRVDFVSIGTNDLVQYLLAVDRDNARVANRYDTLHPAVVRALSDACARARRAGTSVGVCGEMAGELEAVLLFVGMGVDDLSASPARLPFVKAVVRAVTRERAREVLGAALLLETGAEIRAMLRAELERCGLGELVARRGAAPFAARSA